MILSPVKRTCRLVFLTLLFALPILAITIAVCAFIWWLNGGNLTFLSFVAAMWGVALAAVADSVWHIWGRKTP